MVGFALGLVGSTSGAFVTAWISSIAARRDHQFKRMLETADAIRHDIEQAITLSRAYWEKDGANAQCPHLEGQIMAIQNRIVGALALAKKLDPKRFQQIGETLQDDFVDALTGGQFQVRDRTADVVSSVRVERFGSRLSEKIANCSATPKATRIFSS